MRALVRLAARLYPRSWRRRYGNEFEALLADVTPGWRELFDVISGAVTMQIRTIGAIPVICALGGAVVGALVAFQTPSLFASSATIRLANERSVVAEEVRGTVRKALQESGLTPVTTLVTMPRDAAQSVVNLTLLHRDAAVAQRAAQQVTKVMTATWNQRTGAAEVLSDPVLPAAPIPRDYSTMVASGGGIGLAVGAVALLLRRLLRPA